MNQLEPCPHCQRHVFVSETTCPFCAEPTAFADVPSRRAPPSRLGRAATFAFGGVLAISQASCDDEGSRPPGFDAGLSDATKGDGPRDGAMDDADDGGVAIYGAAPTPDKTPPTNG